MGIKATGFFVVHFVLLPLDFGIFPAFLPPSFGAKATGFFVVLFGVHFVLLPLDFGIFPLLKSSLVLLNAPPIDDFDFDIMNKSSFNLYLMFGSTITMCIVSQL